MKKAVFFLDTQELVFCERTCAEMAELVEVRNSLTEDGRTAVKMANDAPAPTCRNHFALLEFVEDDNPACFLRDAATLRAWLAQEPS